MMPFQLDMRFILNASSVHLDIHLQYLTIALPMRAIERLQCSASNF